MMTTIKIAMAVIQSLWPACISSGMAVGRALFGGGVNVPTGCLTVGVGLTVWNVSEKFSKRGALAENVMPENAVKSNKTTIWAIECLGGIVQKFTKSGDRVSPQYNTAEMG